MSYKPVKLPKDYKPSDKEEYMNPNQLEYFREKLLAWKEDLARESQNTMEHLRDENWNEPDLNDRAWVETETSLELKTRDRYRKLMNKIDAAIGRIENGSYGYCEETGDPIGIKRLEARPIATLSIEAQERHERFERSHSEE
jgi:DnaK suppressor protein